MERSLYSDSARAEHGEMSKERLEDALDEALEETFPASDPVSVIQPVANLHDRPDRQRR
jgi:hypothetical protein